MKKRVKFLVILEDDRGRRSAMQRSLEDLCPPRVVVFFDDSRELRDWLSLHAEEVAVLSLDHDLAVEADARGRAVDHGTGLDVAEYLAGEAAAFPIVIASTNAERAAHMEQLLQQAGWSVRRVIPYDDLTWVKREWRHAMRDALVSWAVPAPRPATEIPGRVAELVRLGAEAGDGAVPLGKEDVRLLRRWLRRVVVRVTTLVAHVDWLRGAFVELPGELLPWPRTRAFLRRGPRALPTSELLNLLRNAVALFDLHDRVHEHRSSARRGCVPQPVVLRIVAEVGPARLKNSFARDGREIRKYVSKVVFPSESGLRRGWLEWECEGRGQGSSCSLRVGIRLGAKLAEAIRRQQADPLVKLSAPGMDEITVSLSSDNQGNLRSAWSRVPGPPEANLRVVIVTPHRESPGAASPRTEPWSSNARQFPGPYLAPLPLAVGTPTG